MLNENALKDITFRLLQTSKELTADPSILPGSTRNERKFYTNYLIALLVFGLIKRKVRFYYSSVIWLEEPKYSPSQFSSWGTVMKSITELDKSGWIRGQCAIWIIVGFLFGMGLGLIIALELGHRHTL